MFSPGQVFIIIFLSSYSTNLIVLIIFHVIIFHFLYIFIFTSRFLIWEYLELVCKLYQLSSAHENDCSCDDHYSLYVLNVSHNMSV